MANIKNINRDLGAQGLAATTLGATADVYSQQLIDATQAGEQAYAGILGQLGRPGTYGTLSSLLPQVGGMTQTGGVNVGIPDASLGASVGTSEHPGLGFTTGWNVPTNLMKTYPAPDWIKNQITWVGEQPKGGAGSSIAAAQSRLPNITTVDPNLLTQSVLSSPQGQMVSFLTAQANQLAQHTGPLYDQFVQEITKGTMEQAQATGKQQEALLRSNQAQAGWARPTQANAMMKAQLDMQTNMAASQQLDQAMLQLNTWVGPYAQSVAAFNQEWAAGLPFIRSAYQQAMGNATEMMVTGALPFNLQSLSMQTQWGILDQRSKVKKNWVGSLVGLGLAVVGGILTFGAGAGVFGAVGGMIGAGLGAAAGPVSNLLAPAGTTGFNSNVLGGVQDALNQYRQQHPGATPTVPNITSAPSYSPYLQASQSAFPQASQFDAFVASKMATNPATNIVP